MIVNIALLTVTDTRTFDNDKSGAILVDKIKEANHKLIDRRICKDNKDDIVLILKEWTNQKEIDVIITTGGTGLTVARKCMLGTADMMHAHAYGLGAWQPWRPA